MSNWWIRAERDQQHLQKHLKQHLEREQRDRLSLNKAGLGKNGYEVVATFSPIPQDR